MSDDNQSSKEDSNKNFIYTILSYISHKYIYLGGFLLTATTLIIPDLNRYIELRFSILRGQFVFIILSLLILLIAFINISFNIFRDNGNMKKELDKLAGRFGYGAIRTEMYPNLRKACAPRHISPNTAAKAVIILDPSDWFHQSDLVSIFDVAEDIETEIGYGHVLNIHERNKMIQIEVLYMSRQDILRELLNNNADYLKRVEVRPHISKNKLEEYKLLEEL